MMELKNDIWIIIFPICTENHWHEKVLQNAQVFTALSGEAGFELRHPGSRLCFHQDTLGEEAESITGAVGFLVFPLGTT